MIKKLKSFFGISPGVDLGTVIEAGAKIIDVRTTTEFSGGHVKGAVNIPLDVLRSKAGKLNKDEAIVTCCASGVRSRSARSVLQSMGFTKVYNGGGWRSLIKYQ